jgi:hypothetical protein
MFVEVSPFESGWGDAKENNESHWLCKICGYKLTITVAREKIQRLSKR